MEKFFHLKGKEYILTFFLLHPYTDFSGNVPSFFLNLWCQESSPSPKCFSFSILLLSLPTFRLLTNSISRLPTPRKRKMEGRKRNFSQVQKCHACLFYTSKTQNGMDETQLPSSSKLFIHVLHFEDSKWHG